MNDLRPTRSSRKARAAALAMVALWLGGHLAGAAHLLAVRHVTCPEHGELVHVDEAGSAARGGTSPETRIGSILAADALRLRHGHHDHCVIAVHQRNDLLVVQPAATTSTPPPYRVVPVASAAPRAAAVAVYRVAPKSSPPA